MPSTDSFNAYATKVATYGVYDVVSNTRPLFISSINDPGNVTANDVTVSEGSATLTLNTGNANLSVADPDSNGATSMSTTVTVGKGVISAVGGAGGTVSGTGTNTITITGATQAELNSRLQALTITFPDDPGAPTSADWNGSFTVTVVYNDGGNTGTRPTSLTGDTNNPAAYPGDYSYADGSSNILVTTRTFTVTVNGVNDAPTRTDATAVTLPAATEDTNGGSGDTVSNLFGGKFSDALDNISGGSGANSFAGIAITTNNAIAAQGKWQYSTDGGTNWTDLPAVSASSALLLDTNARLRFDPAPDFHGTPGGLDARLIDSSGGAVTSGTSADVSGANAGGTTRYSDASNAVTLNTTVSNVNDRPTGTDTTLASIPEDSTNPAGATVASLGFGYADATDDQHLIDGGGNAVTAFGGIAIVGNSADAGTQGVWQYSTDGGGTWTAVGTPSDTSALILPTSASLRFVPVANYNGTPGGLSVRVADSAQTFSANTDISTTINDQTSTWSTTHTLGTTVTPQNDAPTLTNTATNPTVTENATTGSGTSIDPVALLGSGTLSDIDLTTTAVLSAPTFGAGTITVTLTDGVAGDVLQVASGVTAGIAGTSGGTGSTPLVITLTNTATVADVEAILAAIQYKNTSDNPTNFGADTTRSYTVVLNDGNNVQPGGNAGGPTALDATTINGTITLVATNDPPVGVDDSNSVTEDSGTPATGNVLTGGTPDHDPDNTTAELTVAGIRTGPEAGVGTAGTLGTPLAGQYGSLTLNTDGSYSYALDNANPAVNALLTGQTLTETFTYTVRDPGGLTDTAQLTITIHGHTDGAPSITPVDGNGAATGEATVLEHGLTSVSDTTETTTGTINVSAPDGMTSVTIGGVTFTVAQLNSFTSASPSAAIDTGEGILRVTGFTSSGDPAAPTAGTLTYTYTLKAPLDQPGATESSDAIALTIADTNAVTANGILTVQIIDDTPTAADDNTSVLKQTGSVTGNVYGNDAIGADGAATGGPVTPQTSTGSYGSLALNADGSYTYTVDQTNPAVIALAGGSLTDTFTYTITDHDGDISTATLTVTINGNRPPVANDDTRTAPADTPVNGNVLTGSGGDVADSDPEGDPLTVVTFTIQGTTYPAGGTALIPGIGQITIGANGGYTFIPAPGWIGGTPPITYVISDGHSTDSAILNITIVPDNPPLVGPPFNPTPSPSYSLLSRDPLTISPVVTDPSVYFLDERFNDVRRLPIPFHPIVYVNRAVESAQAERAMDDAHQFGRPEWVAAGDIRLSSQTPDLGMDPNLFIQHAVRDSQQQATFIGRVVDGRYGRITLSSDHALPTPELFQPDARQLLEKQLKKQPLQPPAEARPDKESAATSRIDTSRMQSTTDTAVAGRMELVASWIDSPAPSFADQLRGGTGRLPLPARARAAQSAHSSI